MFDHNQGVIMGFDQGSDRGGFGGGRPREFHKATCSECQKECEVPFKPSGDRPVYCKDCFAKRKDGGR
jgi:CxxC-x17-CxxC domain-containing protein